MKTVMTDIADRHVRATFARVLVYGNAQQDASLLLERALPFLQPGETHIDLVEQAGPVPAITMPRGEPLARVVDSLERLGIRVERHRQRSSTDALMRQVMEGGYDLVVKAVGVDAYGRRTLNPLAIRFLESCPATCWLVECVSPRPIARVLVAVDPQPRGEGFEAADARQRSLAVRLASVAQAVAARTAAELHVLHAWNCFGDQVLRMFVGAERLEGYARDAQERAASLLDDVLAGAGVTVASHQRHLVKGAFGDVAPRVIADQDIDTVVIGTRGRLNWLGPVVQPHAANLVSSTHASLLVLKAP